MRIKRILAIFLLMVTIMSMPAFAMELPGFLGQTPNRKELSLVRKYPKEAAKVYKCSQEAIAEVGKSAAKRWANAHEYGKKGKATRMDKHNNKVGRKIKTKGSHLMIAYRVRKAVKRGKCKRLNSKRKLVKTNGDGLVI